MKELEVGGLYMLKLHEVQKALDAKILVGEDQLDRVAEMACGCDLMSDVLAFTKIKTLLLTGLTNIQVINTANVSDLSALIFVRGKVPGHDIVEAARAASIPVMLTNYTLFEACGILYSKGLKGCPAKKPSGKGV